MVRRIGTLGDISGDYDVILSDVWGVLHNGVCVFLDAAKALAAARAGGATVVLVTNSPRLRQSVIDQLRALGVSDDAYDRIVTSGDVTRGLIEQGPKKVFLLGPERDLPLLEGLGTEIIAVSAAADCVVCTGFFDDETETPEVYTEMLRELLSRHVPMICANPDLVVEHGHRINPCAEAIAAYYKQMGGETRIAGKPHAPIYTAALEEARDARGDFETSRVMAIGDGMPTDVHGALAAGFDLLYISGGIHVADYALHGETNEDLLKAWLKAKKATPLWWMPCLA